MTPKRIPKKYRCMTCQDVYWGRVPTKCKRCGNLYFYLAIGEMPWTKTSQKKD